MRYFVHMSVADRRIASDAINAARIAFARSDSGSALTDDNPHLLAEVQLESGAGVAQFSKTTAKEDVVDLAISWHARTPPHTVRFIEAQGSIGVRSPPLERAWFKSKLDSWVDALGSVNGEHERAVVDEARRRTEEIIGAVANGLDPTWEYGCLSTRTGGSHAELQLFAGRAVRLFLADGGSPRDGTMSASLKQLLMNVTDPFVHMIGRRSNRPKELRVTIGQNPEIRIKNDIGIMDSLRQMGKMPVDVRLEEPK